MGFQFGKSSRLLKPAEYKNIFSQPVRSADKYFTVLAKNNQMHEARLGLAVSKKNVRLAVQRNRLKRLSRESFRNHKTQLAGLDLVVLARHGTDRFNNKILLDSLSAHWKTIKRKFSNLSDS